MPNPHQNCVNLRSVSDLGETLIVREVDGVRRLTDACHASQVVYVPSGRRAVLVDYHFRCHSNHLGRNSNVLVTRSEAGLSFICVRHSIVKVPLHHLPLGLKVDVLPANDPAVAYAVLLRPLPVLHGAVAVQPLYANNELVAA